MYQNCKLTTKIVFLVSLVAGLSACETQKSRNPLSPNIAGPIEGVVISAPALMEPVNGALLSVAAQPLTLKFGSAASNSERPFWYEVQVATDGDFAHVVHLAEQVTPNANGSGTAAAEAAALREGAMEEGAAQPEESYQVPETFDPEQKYFWRVRALDGANTGPYSEATSFEVFTPVTVGVVTPLSPIDGAVVTSQQPTFQINNAVITGPATNVEYRFEVASNSSFSNLVAVLTVGAGGSTTLATPGELAWNKTFFWRVRASADGREGRVNGPWSTTESFKTPPLPVGTPVPVSPINGATASSNPPVFVVSNGPVSGAGGAVRVIFRVSTTQSFDNVVSSFEVPMSGGSQTSATSGVLTPGKVYYWRVIAKNDLLTTAWSAWQKFRTPNAPAPPSGGGGGGGGGFTPGGSPNAPFTTNGGNPPNLSSVVQQVASEHPGAVANSCPHEGGSWEFLDRVVEALRAIDGRWAYNCKRGDCNSISVDAITYYRGSGNPNNSSNVSIIDMISAVCGAGANPSPAWIDVTHETQQAGAIGRYKYPR